MPESPLNWHSIDFDEPMMKPMPGATLQLRVPTLTPDCADAAPEAASMAAADATAIRLLRRCMKIPFPNEGVGMVGCLIGSGLPSSWRHVHVPHGRKKAIPAPQSRLLQKR